MHFNDEGRGDEGIPDAHDVLLYRRTPNPGVPSMSELAPQFTDEAAAFQHHVQNVVEL